MQLINDCRLSVCSSAVNKDVLQGPVSGGYIFRASLPMSQLKAIGLGCIGGLCISTTFHYIVEMIESELASDDALWCCEV